MKITIFKIATRIASLVVFCFFSMSILAVEKYTIIWSVLGDTSLFPPRIIEEGNSIGDFPIPKIECDGKVFYGWTEVPTYNHPTEPPAIINERTIPQTSTTYYAVFAEKIQKTTWDRTELEQISPTDEVVIIVSIEFRINNIDSVLFYAFTEIEENKLLATSISNINEEHINSTIVPKYIWYIDNAESIIKITSKNHNDFLYCTASEVRVGSNSNYNEFKIDNQLLYNTSRFHYIYLSYNNSGLPYWACSSNPVANQKLLFFRKNAFLDQHFTTLCTTSSLPLQIIEWKQDAIVVMYNGDPNQQAKIYINGNAKGENVTLSDCHKDVAIYEIPILGLASHTNQQLDIIIADQKKTCIIPLIISEETSTNDVVNLSLNTDIVIQKGGILTLNSSEINAQTWGNVTIYGGGKIIVGPECAFNASSIIMRVGSVENGEYHAAYPQFVLQGQLGIVSNFYLDYLTTYDRYYALSIPYEVSTTDIHYPIDIYGENVLPENKGSFTLQYYDGESRAEKGVGWKDLEEPSTLIPYQGYTFWGAPKKVSVNGADKVRQKFGIHRLPISNINIIKEVENKNISVVAHGNEQTNDNDRGWNFLGNPYLGVYTGSLGNIRYITQTNDGKKYFSNEVSNVTLDPFNTYFVQVEQNQTIPFTTPNSSYIQSPQKDKCNEISIGIQLSCKDIVDRVGILIADMYTANYDFNADLAKFDNHDLTVYAISKNGNLSYMAINPQIASKSIEIGYKVLENSHLTFQFDSSRYDALSIDKLCLIDKERNVTTDLLQADYSFYSDAGNFDQRFILEISIQESNATNTPICSLEPNIILESHNLKISNLSFGAHISIFNVLGHCFYQQTATSSELVIQIPKGYYILNINGVKDTIFIP